MLFNSIIIFLICACSGVLSGLLGIGGGLVLVPMFMTVLPMFGLNILTTHQIVAVSTTCIFFNSATSIFYRRKEEFLDKKQLLTFSVFIMLGTVLGSFYSSFSHENFIFITYIFVCLLSIYFMNKNISFDLSNSKLKYLLYLIFSIIGALCATIGIGGAVFFATTLKCFFDKNTKELLPSITFLVFIQAIFAFLSKLFLHEVILYIIPIAILSSLCGAKIGVILSKKISSRVISILMQLVLVLGIIRMSFEFFAK